MTNISRTRINVFKTTYVLKITFKRLLLKQDHRVNPNAHSIVLAILDLSKLLGTIYGYVEPFGTFIPFETIWKHLGPFRIFGTILEHLRQFKTIWDHLGQCPTILDHYEPSGIIWNTLGHFGTTCDHLGQFGTVYELFA